MKPLGFKFRQQAPIDPFIVDFVCLAERLIVEVDGATHSTSEEMAADTRWEQHLRRQGFRIVRVSNTDVYGNVEGVMDLIVHTLEAGARTSSSTPPRKREGSY